MDNSELNFQIIGSSLNDRNILKVKWLPFAADHIAVLHDDNTFMIYDFGNNIDEPEITLDLTSLDPKKRLVSEFPPLFEDFTFSQNKDAYDCSIFSIFFMNNYGDIYYKCPIIVNGMKIPKKLLVFLRKRIDHEKKANVVDKELIDRIQGFIKSIEDFSSEDETNQGNLQIKGSKIPQNINVNEGPLQGYFFISFGYFNQVTYIDQSKFSIMRKRGRIIIEFSLKYLILSIIFSRESTKKD